MEDNECCRLDEQHSRQADGAILGKRLKKVTHNHQGKGQGNKLAPELNASPNGMSISGSSRTTHSKPQFQILRRGDKYQSNTPEKHTKTSETTSASKSSQHNKSLQQREVEYAKARLRIFGSQPPPDDDRENIDDEISDTRKTDDIGRHSSPRIIKPGPPSSPVTVINHPRVPDQLNCLTNSHTS